MILSFFFFFSLKGFWFSLFLTPRFRGPSDHKPARLHGPPSAYWNHPWGSFLLACPALTTAAPPETQVTCQVGSGQVPPQPRIRGLPATLLLPSLPRVALLKPISSEARSPDQASLLPPAPPGLLALPSLSPRHLWASVWALQSTPASLLAQL